MSEKFKTFLYITGPKHIPLELEVWYHGPMSRAEAELLLEDEGDFLVRESKSKAGQYVLSGVQNSQPRHLLLVDPQGKVINCLLLLYPGTNTVFEAGGVSHVMLKCKMSAALIIVLY